MIRPCEFKSTCVPCADGNPLANLSSEDPDQERFLALYYFEPDPLAGTIWRTPACTTFCESAISQEDADDCARRLAQTCVWNPPPPNEIPDPPEVFCNTEITCQSDIYCYAMEQCSVFGLSQADADAVAASLCNHRVMDPNIRQICPVPAPPPMPDPPPPEPMCEAETGSPAPSSLGVFTLVDWETLTVTSAQLPTYVGIIGGQLDHPPGPYGIRWISGHMKAFWPFFPDPDPYLAQMEFDGLTDTGTPANQLATDLRDCVALPPTGSHVQELCGGGPCGSAAAAEAAAAALFLDRLFCADPYPPDNATTFSHENLGGDFRVGISGASMPASREYPVDIVFQIVQLGGLIPQPRKILISDYAANQAAFMDQDAAAAWDGTFPTRSVYSGNSVNWVAASGGAFGGALVQYITTHPTSANGRGWQLDIFSAGMILMWRGLKAVGDTSEGRYYRDNTTTPMGPPCLTCIDDSDIQWFPP